MENNIAVCLSGMLGRAKLGKDDIPLDVKHSIESLKKNVLKDVKHDIFSHTWANQEIEKTFASLNPTQYSITDPIKFSKPTQIELYYHDLRRGVKSFLKEFGRYKFNFSVAQNKLNNCMSQLYSQGSSLNLMINYANINKIKYTHVLVTRYDVEFFSKFNFNNLSEKYIYIGEDNKLFDKKNNQIPQRFYWEKVKSGENLRMESINFMDENNTIDDMLYICSYKNAIKMANLFNKMTFYLLNGTRLSAHALLERHIQEVMGLKNVKFCKRRLIDYELSRRFRLGEVV